MTTQTLEKTATTLKIEVGIQDIVGAEQANSHFCPVARALSRYLEVPTETHHRFSMTQYQVYHHSPELEEAIRNYDYFGTFTPGTYEIRIS